MKPFTYEQAATPAGAVAAFARVPGSRYIAGGTNLLDLMKLQVETPANLVDLSRLPRDIVPLDDGSLRIDALVTNTDLAANRIVRDRYPMLSEAIVAGASPQLRNRATTGGNLLQRTRCAYFYDTARACNKRVPGSGCDAIGGHNRGLAILGATEQCIATHPGDMTVALAALDAVVHLEGVDGMRAVPIDDFHRLPGHAPQRDTNMRPGELITAIVLPPAPPGRMRYRKVRDRASYAFALVSVAAALAVEEGVVMSARIALGRVAHKPWRARAAERALVGRPAAHSAFVAAAEAELGQARGWGENDFKSPLAHRLLVGVLNDLTSGKAG